MKKVTTALLALSLAGVAATEEVTITSDRFEADEKSRITRFIGHVQMQKGSDELNASKVVVYFDARRKPVRYEAQGGTTFVIHMRKEGKYYTGKAKKLIYRPARQIYELYGDVVLKEPRLDRTITGEKVVVEKLDGRALVEGGGKRPVKFIFKVEENNASTDR